MNKFLFSLISILFSGCYSAYQIQYRTENIQPVSETSLPISVDMRILKDIRKDDKQNIKMFKQDKFHYNNGKRYCINAEENYAADQIPERLTELIVNHFNKAKLFKRTYFKQSAEANYYLAANLKKFYGEQEYHNTKYEQNSSINSNGDVCYNSFIFSNEEKIVQINKGKKVSEGEQGYKTPGKIIIELSDVRLYRKSDNKLIEDFGDFKIKTNDEFFAYGFCWCIYDHVSIVFSQFNTEFSKIIYEYLKSKNW